VGRAGALELGVTDRLPDIRRIEGRAVSRPAPAPRQTRGGGDAFRDFLRRLVEYETLYPILEEWEVKYAAIGALSCLAVAGISLTLPGTSSIANGRFDLFGLVTQEIAGAGDLLRAVVAVVRGATWPLLVVGAMGLVIDAYFAVRPRQPIGLHYVCAAQMLLGFLAGLALATIYGIVLANIALGLLAVAFVVIVGIIVLGIAVVILGGLARL
jgi:hypothetical protein